MLQQLAPQYVDTGKAWLVYRNFPIIGPESQIAAQAAECAGDQGQFWTYANDLFSRQAGENTGAFAIDNLKSFAAQLGLDAGAFNSCLDSGKYATAVQQQLAEGQQRGVRATPTFFINGHNFEGVLSYEQMTALIDAALPGGAK